MLQTVQNSVLKQHLPANKINTRAHLAHHTLRKLFKCKKGENWMGPNNKLNIFQWFHRVLPIRKYYILSASSSHFMRSSYGNFRIDKTTM